MAGLHALIEIAQPELAPFGLLSPAANVVENTDPHWVNGFSYRSTDCNTQITLRAICASSVATTAVAPAGTPKYLNYVPFSVEATYSCSTMGMLADDYFALAKQRLEECFQKAAEYELWTGSLSAASAASSAAWNATNDGAFPNRYLASTNSVDVTPTQGTAVKPVEGLALLENALGNCGCGTKGTIHVTRGVGSVLNPYLVRSTSDTLVTGLGNAVIAGSGYTGTGPTGASPGGTKVWMYATGEVTVLRGEVFLTPDKNELRQAVKTDTNDVTVKAEQPAAVVWSGCCAFAVLVDLSSTYN